MSDYEPRIKPVRAQRHNQGKPRPSLIPVEFIEELMAVLEKGAQKYEKNNWKKGLPTTEVLDSLERHLIEFKKGIDIDPDDGLSTLTKIAVNALFLRYYQLKGMSQFDDREK